MKSKKIIVKVGTNSITNEDGSLKLELMESLVKQIAKLREDHDVLFVSSGAMGAGRGILGKEMRHDDVTNRQLYAVVGQVKLMEIYSGFFKENGRVVAQMLATKQDFENRDHYLNTKNCIESLFVEGIVPILNENDFVCTEELMFTDNDELAGIVAKMLFADQLIMLTGVDGVLDDSGNVVGEFEADSEVPDHIESAEASSFGKGGIHNKFKISQEVAGHGTEVFVANADAEGVITRIAEGEHVGTRFIPKKKS